MQLIAQIKRFGTETTKLGNRFRKNKQNEEFKRLYDLMAKKLNDGEIERMNNEFLKFFGEEKFGTKEYVKFTRKWFQKVADEINESNKNSELKLIIQNGTDIVGKVKDSKVFIKFFVRELK